MSKFKNKYRVESTRLPEYDYSQAGAYFITMCTHNKNNYFGEIIDGKMHLSEIGKVVEEEWLKTPSIREDMNVSLDYYVVMPNHFHAILNIGVNQFNLGLNEKWLDLHNYASKDNKTNPIVETHCMRLENQNEQNTETKIISSLPNMDANVETHCYASQKEKNLKLNNQTSKLLPQSKNIPAIIRGFKSAVTSRCKKIDSNFKWQPNYYEHIIRNEKSLFKIRNYIQYNPLNWSNDELFSK